MSRRSSIHRVRGQIARRRPVQLAGDLQEEGDVVTGFTDRPQCNGALPLAQCLAQDLAGLLVEVLQLGEQAIAVRQLLRIARVREQLREVRLLVTADGRFSQPVLRRYASVRRTAH
ncbi:MAG: hypothetical protein GEU90_00555 [Gemmatimonas sp.]|nr:hypothetical protein [Gemmatimonas sp.]